MHYMANHFDLRTNPSLLVPGARSVITLLLNYFPADVQPKELPQVSKYAYGQDYHEVIRKKLHEFLFELRSAFGEVNGRGFVDSAPVLERAWAVKSGLGWIGKNGNLINKKQGSFLFISTLITDLEIEPDDPSTYDHCGSCTRCIDSCPTEAILPGRVIDGSKCISYFTIELKEEKIPHPNNDAWGNWVFGCDICQDVCPWNRFSKVNHTENFSPKQAIFEFSVRDWEALTEQTFKDIFKDSPISRTKLRGMKRNIEFIKNKP